MKDLNKLNRKLLITICCILVAIFVFTIAIFLTYALEMNDLEQRTLSLNKSEICKIYQEDVSLFTKTDELQTNNRITSITAVLIISCIVLVVIILLLSVVYNALQDIKKEDLHKDTGGD